MTPPKKKRIQIAPLLLEALRERGHLLPETEREIAAAEERISNDVDPLPDRLLQPFHSLNPSVRFRPRNTTATPSQQSGIEEAMARAARFGGTIPKEVEAQMRRDRKEAVARDKKSDDD